MPRYVTVVGAQNAWPSMIPSFPFRIILSAFSALVRTPNVLLLSTNASLLFYLYAFIKTTRSAGHKRVG